MEESLAITKVDDLKVIEEVIEVEVREHHPVDEVISQRVLDGLGEATGGHDQGDCLNFQVIGQGVSWGKLGLPLLFCFI